jgi:hypothetical protein
MVAIISCVKSCGRVDPIVAATLETTSGEVLTGVAPDDMAGLPSMSTALATYKRLQKMASHKL